MTAPLSMPGPNDRKISRAAYGELVRLAMLKQRGLTPGDPLVAVGETGTEPHVVNNTGGDLNRFSIVKIGASVPTDVANPTTFNRRIFYGETPESNVPIAVIQEPLNADQKGTAVAIGATWVRVNVTNTSHTHARPTSSTAELASSVGGPARILHCETDAPGQRTTGSQWAAVLLGGSDGSGGGHLIVTSTTTTGGRYPALDLDEVGRPVDWPTAEPMWAEDINGAALSAGRKYEYTKLTADKFLGWNQAGVVECCDPLPGPLTDCGCDFPALGCMTFDSTATCIDGMKLIMFGGGSAPFSTTCCTTLASNPETNWVSFACIGTNTWLIMGAWSGAAVTECCILQFETIEVDCGPPFVATITGTLQGATSGVPCSEDDTAFTATWVAATDLSDCVNPFSSSLCQPAGGCVPSFLPEQITGTFGVVSGTCAPDPDGQEAAIWFRELAGEQFIWSGSGTLNGHDYYIVWQCTGFVDGAWSGQIVIDVDDDGTFSYSVAGTITESPTGTWTISFDGINTGDGCVVDLNLSFLEGNCASGTDWYCWEREVDMVTERGCFQSNPGGTWVLVSGPYADCPTCASSCAGAACV